jgi:hypothetical protein
MQLNEFHENNRARQASRALKEHYSIDYDLSKMDARSTRSMLTRVRGLLSESRQGRRLHESHKNPAYLKLIMMEQMLSSHYDQVRLAPYNIVVENEEVEKSEVILAAQDMIDTVQDMIEKISKMNVEQLPALSDSISSEFGTSESEQYTSSVGETLTALQQALTQAKTGLQGGLGTLTGQGGGDFGAPAGEEEFAGTEELPGGGEEEFAGTEELGGDEGGELPELPELPAEEPEAPVGPAGRERR